MAGVGGLAAADLQSEWQPCDLSAGFDAMRHSAQYLDAHTPKWHEDRMKPQSHPQTCEIKSDDTWREVSLREAIKSYQLVPKRCPECHGLLVLYGGHIAGTRPYLTHHRSHTGCSLKPNSYSGTQSLHPKAIS